MKIRGTWQLKGRAGVILALAFVASAVSGVVFLGATGAPQQRTATTKTAAATVTPSKPSAPAATSSYRDGVVAYLYNGTPVSREQLGEYLIDRFGGERLEPFINKVIVERACQERGITVTPNEVDADLAETLKSVPGDKRLFLDNLLRSKQMTLKEWKADVVRPKLLLTKYCRDREGVRFSEDDVAHAFESMYGEKVMVQIIIWTPEEFQKGRPADVHGKISADKEAFDLEARGQWDKKLAATAGQLKPFGRYSQENHEMETLAFNLKEGEITPVLSLFQGQDPEKIGGYVMKCLKRFPPDPSKKLQDVRADLEREIMEYKLKHEIGVALEELRKAANPQIIKLDEVEGEKRLPPGSPEQAVATIYGNVHLTREQFGEYLIDRDGAERLDLFLNRLIVEYACKAKGITVSEAEIEEQLKQYIALFAGGSKKELVNRMLKPNKATLYELRNDVLWTKLMLGKLCRDRVQVTEAELKQAYDSHYGEKMRVRMIMWPKDEERNARNKYFPLIRDDDKEFIRLAKQQVIPELASKAGETEIARHASGHEEVEKIAFEMQKGDISPIISLPECVMVFRVLDRVPPSETVKMDDVRTTLTQEVTEAKLRAEVIPSVYKELRKEANAILLLKNQMTEEELKREVVRELQGQDKSIITPRNHAAAPRGN